MLFALKFHFMPCSSLFGLVIGINKYNSNTIHNLQGHKEDAQSMVDLLAQKYHKCSSHFLCLANERATCSAIIAKFQDHLINNNNIECGDHILLYYTGHSRWATALKGRDADENQVKTICPHHERTEGDDHKETFGIPDQTIDGLCKGNLAIPRSITQV
jgi:hypothetical protein